MNLADDYDAHAAYLEARALEVRHTPKFHMGGWVGYTTPGEDLAEAAQFREMITLLRS